MIHNIIVDSCSHQVFTKEAAKKSHNGLQFHHVILPLSVVQTRLAGGQRKGRVLLVYKLGHQLLG